MMWDGGYGWGGLGAWLGMGFMMFFGLLVLIGIIVLIVWLARSSSTHAGGHMATGTTTACDIAKQRYARGEITKEQFDDICRTVGG